MEVAAIPGSSHKARKRSKIKGCHECARRRIDCDRQQPTCLKCHARNLKCSGLGVRYRFSGSFATRGKLVGRAAPNILSYKSTQPSDRCLPDQDEDYGKSTQRRSQPFLNRSSPPLSFQQHLDHIDGHTRWYLRYFSQHITPVTAVIDLGFNGYRDLILPAAENDALIRKAIVAVAHQHLVSQSGMMVGSGQQLYGSLISDLISRSEHFAPHQDGSTLTTLLLLHVREMISGGGDFKLLFGPLRSVVRSTRLRPQGSRSRLEEFVQIQIMRVCLFGEALFDEEGGAEFLTAHGEDCLEFLRFCQMFHPEFEQLMSYLFQMIKIACNLYIQRALFNPQPHDTIHHIEHFKGLTQQVDRYNNTVGRHLLVWSFFVVAAESSTAEHRSFFLNKLQSLHRETRSGNITRAIEQLQNIWTIQSSTR